MESNIGRYLCVTVGLVFSPTISTIMQVLIIYQLAVRIIMKMRHSVSANHLSRLMMTVGACWGMVMYSDGLRRANIMRIE